MLRRELTAEIFESMEMHKVLYAEYAEGGAMGNTGGLIISVIENHETVYYETNLFDNRELYIAASWDIRSKSNYRFLDDYSTPIIFDYHYGGFGNHVYLNISYFVGRTSISLLFEKEKTLYEILCSNPGVFQSIISSIEHKTGLSFDKNKSIKLRESYTLEISRRDYNWRKKVNEMKARDKSMGRDMESILKKYGVRFSELLHIFNKHDPQELIKIGCPTDEYSPEARSIIVQLDKNQTVQEIQTIIYSEFVRFFSKASAGPKNNYKKLAEDIHQWIKHGGLIKPV